MKPGDYTIRLIVGEESYEKPVKVVMDPTLIVSPEELERQFEFVLEVQSIQSCVSDVLRGLDGLSDQIRGRQKTARNRDISDKKTLVQSLVRHLADIERLESQLVRPALKIWPPIDQPPRLSEKLSDLFSQVEGANAAPTSAQEEIRVELKDDFRKIMLEVSAYLSESAPKINSLLEEYGLPSVLIPDPILKE